MDVNTFYELRTRLYATAAAGCGLITEDFRLKRALEAFKPMSEANKVFGRLYQMCEKLFHTENVAGELVDCIALADALAVTQGSFQDKSECVEEEDKLCLKPQTIANRYLREIQDTLLEGGIDAQRNLRKDIHILLEPRLFPSFIQSLKRESEIIRDIAEVLLPQFGDTLISVLKDQIDFETTGAKNRTAYYVKLIARLYGEKENDWYIAVAENTEYPQSIRSAAVWALGRSEKNTAKLLEFYKTQKGKVKNAVIFELARLDPPEAEEVWKKLTEKYKDSYIDFIAWSKSDTCAEFVRQKVYEIVGQFEEDYKKGKKRIRGTWYSANIQNTGMDWIRKTICRKYQLEDCFHLFAEKYECISKIAPYPDSYGGSWIKVINDVLIENLLEDDVRYSEMIKNLYKKHKDFYFRARFVLALKEAKEAALEDYWDEMHRHRQSALDTLGLEYDSCTKKYFISWTNLAAMSGIGRELYQSDTSSAEKRLQLFDTFPDRLITFASETDYFIEEKVAQFYDVDGSRSTSTVLSYALYRITPKEMDSEELIKDKVEDYKKCREAALKFAFEVNEKYSIGSEIEVIEKLYQGESGKCKGLVTNYVMQNIFAHAERDIRYQAYNFIYKIESLPMKDEDRKNELLELKKKVEALETTSLKKSLQKDCEENKKITLNIIQTILHKHGWES